MYGRMISILVSFAYSFVYSLLTLSIHIQEATVSNAQDVAGFQVWRFFHFRMKLQVQILWM